jgi:hypothetical protein
MAIIAISSIMILMASALRWKEPSIEREIELVHKQHDFQTKLISEMAIPMPFPITGGPFSDYQVKKKRIPFMMSHSYPVDADAGCHSKLTQSSLRSSLRSPLYAEGGHEYYYDSLQEGYFFTEHSDHPDIILMQQQQQHQQQEAEEEEH